jgi:MFS family permease
MPIFISALAGSLAERLGPRPLLVTGMAMQAVALAWMASIVSPTVSYVSLVPPFIIAGIGMSLFFAPAALLVLDAVRPEEEGQASGANNAIRELGGVFGVAVLATVFASSGSFRSPQSFVDGLVPATWVGAAVVAVGAIVALAVPPLRRSAPAGAPPRAESPPTPRTRAGA